VTKFLLERFRLVDGSRFHQDDRLQTQSSVLGDFASILADDDGLQSPIQRWQIGLQGFDLFGESILAKLFERVFAEDLVLILFSHRGVR